MTHNDFMEILKQKGFELKEFSDEIKMSPNGLRDSIVKETMQLKRMKIICSKLGLNPLAFFPQEFQSFYIGKTKNEIQLEKDIEHYKQRLTDKDEIIKLMREKNSGYGIASEPRGYETKLTKK